MMPNPHADPHDNVSCPGCAQYEKALDAMEDKLVVLEMLLVDTQLKLAAAEAAANVLHLWSCLDDDGLPDFRKKGRI